MQKIITLLLALIFTLPLLSQDIRNIDVASSDEKLIITYDLFGKKDRLYQVDILFKKEDGSEIRPKSLNGDIGKNVESGKGKSIVWEVYKDLDGLKGNIEPVMKATEIEQKTKEKKMLNKTLSSNSVNEQIPRFGRKRDIRKHRFGWKIAMGKSYAHVDQSEFAYNRKSGFEAGLFYRLNATRKFYIQPELTFKRQSFEVVEPAGAEELRKLTNHNSYTNANLMFGINPIGHLTFNVGPYVGYMVNAIQKEEVGGAKNTINVLSDSPEMNGEKYPYDRLDFGYNIGGSIDFKEGGFALGVLYSQGLNNVNNQDYFLDDANNSDLNLSNRSIKFYLTFGF